MKIAYRHVVLAALSASCSGTGQDRVQVPLYVAGTDLSEPVVAAFDIPVRVDRADLAFGPLYLCAGASAGALCETARLEWLDAVVVDAAASAPKAAGELAGVTGTVRSWMYDLGISSQLTSAEPSVLGAANELGGVSLVLEGVAEVGGIEVPFRASVAVQQSEGTERGVPVIRKSTSEEFFRDVRPDESALLVRFDASSWVRGIDFRSSVSRETCTVSGPSIACDGTLERTCEGAAELSTQDCAEAGQVCIPNQGCQERLALAESDEAYRSVRNALAAGGRPAFNWDYVP